MSPGGRVFYHSKVTACGSYTAKKGLKEPRLDADTRGERFTAQGCARRGSDRTARRRRQAHGRTAGAAFGGTSSLAGPRVDSHDSCRRFGGRRTSFEDADCSVTHVGPFVKLASRLVRILLWHGYLLSGTGSNVYTRALAREWSRAGHEVVVVCQERHAERIELAGARLVRPELPDGLLPTFVLDRYEGLEPRYLQDFSLAERERYVDANAAALRALLPADLVFANHVLLGAPVAAATGARFAVKAHGSELEYSMRGNSELCEWARATLAGAEAVFVGSGHIRRVLEDVVGQIGRAHV